MDEELELIAEIRLKIQRFIDNCDSAIVLAEFANHRQTPPVDCEASRVARSKAQELDALIEAGEVKSARELVEWLFHYVNDEIGNRKSVD